MEPPAGASGVVAAAEAGDDHRAQAEDAHQEGAIQPMQGTLPMPLTTGTAPVFPTGDQGFMQLDLEGACQALAHFEPHGDPAEEAKLPQ